MPNFCFRLLFRLGMAVASDQTEVNLQTTLCPHPLKLKARTGTLSTSRGLAIESRAYASEEEARGFGTRVLNAMLLGGVVRRLGVDFGTGKRRAQFHEDIKKDIAETGATLRDEIDGLDVTLATTLRDAIPSDVPKEERKTMDRLLKRDTARKSVHSAYMSKFRRLPR